MPPVRGGARRPPRRSAWPCWRPRSVLVVIFVPVSFMSSISGRFLYQFGITAAVAVLVSPARLVHPDADDERPPAARRGRCRRPAAARRRAGRLAARLLRPARPRLRAAAARCAMRAPRAVAALVALGVIARRPSRSTSWSSRSTSPPTWTRRSSRSTSPRPRARAWPPWTRSCARSRPSCAPRRGVRTRARHGRRRLPRRRQPGQRLRAHRAARGAHVLARAASGTGWSPADPLAAFRGNYTQRDVMQEVRAPPRASSATCAPRCATLPSFNIGGGNFDIDFVIRGPDLEALAELRRAPARASPRSSAASSTPTPPSSSTSPSCAWRSTARAPPTSGVDIEDIAHGPAPDGGRRRGGLALPRSGGQRRLRRAAPPDRGRPQRSRRPSRASTCRAAGGGLVRLDNLVTLERGDDRLAHRPARPPARRSSLRAPVAPGYALGRPAGGAAAARSPR